MRYKIKNINKSKLRMMIEVEYDRDLIHGNDPESISWFKEEVLLNPTEGEELILHSNAIGNEIGFVKVLSLEMID